MSLERRGTAETFDLVIVGGGMAGAAAALAMDQAGYRVALLEAGRWPEYPGTDYDVRVSAISPGSQALLDRLGAWSRIAARRISAYERMHVWDAASGAALSFDAATLGMPHLGHIVENRLINAALIDCLRTGGRAMLRDASPVTAIDWGEDWLHINCGRHSLKAALLVAADGMASRVRELAGIETVGYDYVQAAIVANVRTEKPHAATAWQRFLATGPVAFLPLADGNCSIVWSADTPFAEELMGLGETEFVARLESAFASRLGHVTLLNERYMFPLKLLHARRYVGHRLVLLGDAAHRVHPLAGQGINLGFGDVAGLIDTLARARERGRGPGDPRYLADYARRRRAEAGLMIAGMHGIQRLFASAGSEITALRGLGIGLVDQQSRLKGWLARQALGDTAN